MSNSIQFTNKDAVLQAFEDRDVKAWSIIQGRQFMFKGYEYAELIPVLDMLENGATNAIYTLKVYEEIDDKKKIKSNTPDDGSFNFRLNSPEMLVTQAQFNSIPGRNEILDKLRDLEERMNEQNEEKPSLGKLGEVLSHPAFAPLVPALMEKIFAFLTPGGTVPPVARLSGLTVANGITHDNLTDIVNELKEHDEDLEKHLKTLLNIAKTNPAQFKQILSFFN